MWEFIALFVILLYFIKLISNTYLISNMRGSKVGGWGGWGGRGGLGPSNLPARQTQPYTSAPPEKNLDPHISNMSSRYVIWCPKNVYIILSFFIYTECVSVAITIFLFNIMT